MPPAPSHQDEHEHEHEQRQGEQWQQRLKLNRQQQEVCEQQIIAATSQQLAISPELRAMQRDLDWSEI
jgi:hypothetical protein